MQTSLIGGGIANRHAPSILFFTKSIKTSGGKTKLGQSYHVRVYRDDGYFAAALPSGEYLSDMGRTNIPQTGQIWFPGNYDNFYDNREVYKIKFNIIPDRAVYIGTIRLLITTGENVHYKQVATRVIIVHHDEMTGQRKSHNLVTNNLFDNKDECEKVKLPNGMEIAGIENIPEAIICEEVREKFRHSDWQVISEFKEAKNKFSILYPNHDELIEKLGMHLNKK